MGKFKFSESISGWFSRENLPVDEDIERKGVVWNAKGELQSCIFCDFAQNKSEKEILYEDDLVAAFHPLKSAAKQHILVIPKKHISTVGDLTTEDTMVLDRMKSVAESLLKCDPANAQYSFHIPPWNSIDHLHLHALETPFVSLWSGLRFSQGKPWCVSFEKVRIWASGAEPSGEEPTAETKDEEAN